MNEHLAMNGETKLDPGGGRSPAISITSPGSSPSNDTAIDLTQDHRWDKNIQSSVKVNSVTSPTESVSGEVSVNSVEKLIHLGDSTELSALQHTNLEVFPSLDDLHYSSNEIFDMIKAKDYMGVSKILAERGHKVDIVPKVGCSQLHYTKLNVANSENEEGDTPLIVAARTDFRMVDMILDYGGDPNATNKERDSPLSIAAVRGDRDSVDALLYAGANLNAAIIKLTSYLRFQTETDILQSGFESGFSVKSLTFLLSNDVYLKCRDPFRAAFDVSKSIEAIVDVRDEFRMEFELLIRDADVFAYKMLDHCDRMWEAREVLDRSHGLLKKAIDEGKKRFVGHPFSQQIILEEWYGKVAYKLFFGKIRIAFRYIMSPILLPWYFLKFLFLEQHRRTKSLAIESSGAEHMKLLFTPFMCFLTDIFNYLILLGLLIATCVLPKESHVPQNVEIALWCCTLSRLLIECDQMWQQGLWRYLPNMWNVLELFSCSLITAAGIYRIVVWQTYDGPAEDDGVVTAEIVKKMEVLHGDLLNITYLYAITEFFIILRWLNFLEFFPGLGPLLIALRTLIADVFKFVLIVLFTCVMGAAIAVHSVVSTVRSQSDKYSDLYGLYNSTIKKSTDVHPFANKTIPEFFKDFPTCLINVIWSTFGLLEVPVSFGLTFLYEIVLFFVTFGLSRAYWNIPELE